MVSHNLCLSKGILQRRKTKQIITQLHETSADVAVEVRPWEENLGGQVLKNMMDHVCRFKKRKKIWQKAPKRPKLSDLAFKKGQMATRTRVYTASFHEDAHNSLVWGRNKGWHRFLTNHSKIVQNISHSFETFFN